jgi:hypothetical protein
MDMTNANAELMGALASAQAEIENASKTSANPHFKSRYADLAEVLNTCRPVLAKHGICIMQSTGFDGATVAVSTVLAHKSGGWVSAVSNCVPAKTDAQGIGAATTYLRRYSLAAIVAIAQEDDDGQSAQHAGKPAPTRTPAGIDKWLDARQALRDASNMSELGAIWRDLSAEARKVLAQEKDSAKTRLAASEASTEVSE